MPTLREVGEFEAIRRLTQARPPGDGVIVGAGHDAAVMRPEPGRDLVATTDAFVEGRHYPKALIPPRDLGARLAAANLSDLAASAARPRWAVVSMGLSPEHDLDALTEFDAGLAAALAAHGAALVGGNLTAVAGPEWMSLTLFGESVPGQAWSRRGARAGDLIAITGSPGRAGAGLALSRRLGTPAADAWWQPLLDAWLRPSARVVLALALAGRDAVRAAIDVSDGLASDLGHLCDASGVAAELEHAAWPVDPLLGRAAETLGTSLETLRLRPSDDYELVLAVSPAGREACETAARAAHVPLTFVGRFTSGDPGLMLIDGQGSRRELMRTGYDHFAARG